MLCLWDCPELPYPRCLAYTPDILGYQTQGASYGGIGDVPGFMDHGWS
jgi:hypothetical protein